MRSHFCKCWGVREAEKYDRKLFLKKYPWLSLHKLKQEAKYSSLSNEFASNRNISNEYKQWLE